MRSILSWFRRKKPSVLAFTNEPTVSADTLSQDQLHTFLKNKLREGGQTDHTSLQAAARLFFQVDLPTRLWRLRYSNHSLMYFAIAQVHSVFEGDQLSNIQLTLVDEALGTSLKLVIDIRDVPELLVPVFVPL
jgi:hypothetical protein